MKTIKYYSAPLVAASMLLVAGAASAAPIQGDVTFFGAWEARLADATTVTTIENAAHIEFVGDPVIVSQAIGDFAGAAGSVATYQSFTFNPFAGPIAPLWTITVNGTTFSFHLESVGVGFQTDEQLSLSGMGTLIADGYDDTIFSWTFSGDSTGSLLSFSGASFNVAVPEPSVVGLLGLGLIAMGAVGVRRRSSANKAVHALAA